MSHENVSEISPYIIASWQEEIQTASRSQIEEKIEICTIQRRSWMASARGTKSRGSRPWVEVNMAWKYHRHLMMLRRATRKAEAQMPVQASLF